MRITVINLSVLARQAPLKVAQYAASLKRLFLPLFVLLSLLLGAFYGILPFVVKPAAAEKIIVQKLNEVFDGVVYEKFSFSYFPLLTAEFHKARFSHQAQGASLTADSIKILLNPFSILFRRTDIATVEIRNATPSGVFQSLDAAQSPFQNLYFKIGPVKPGAVMRFELRGELKGQPRALSGKGFLKLKTFQNFQRKDAVLDFSLKLNSVSAALLQETLSPASPFEVKTGVFFGDVRFRKEQEDLSIHAQGRMGLKKVSYQVLEQSALVTSPNIDMALAFDFNWNPEKEDLWVNRTVFQTPIGKIEMKGHFLLGSREVKDTRVTVTDLSLENIPQYWIPLKEAIPFNVGFSGLSDLEMSLEGTFSQLSLHANWDLTPALFTYARYFSKPKEIPLSLAFDFLLLGGRVLSGDFSARLKECAIKGTVTGLDVRTGTGLINVLTNKFQLAGWEELLPPLEKYKISGNTKFLANFSGNVRNLSRAEMILNWTLENGSFTGPGGSQIQDVFISLDYSPMVLTLKRARFEIAHSPVSVELVIYKPHNNSLAKAKISSLHFEPLAALEAVEGLGSPWWSETAAARITGLKKKIGEIFPAGKSFENFDAEGEYQQNKWLLKSMRLEAYGGKARAQAALDFSTEVDSGNVTLELDRLSLARFAERSGEPAKLLDGNLFLKTTFSGQTSEIENWQEKWTGSGLLSITNGEFHAFDLLGDIGKIDELKAVIPAVTGTTPFDDVHSNFTFREGEFEMENAELLSRHLSARGEGEVTLEGLLNYRLEVFLSAALTQDILNSKQAEVQLKDKTQFGPIPILLTGPFAKPELEPDPVVIPQIINQLLDHKFQKILSNFAPEESFLERRTSS